MSNIFTELWTVKMSDWQRGLVIAVLTGPFGIVYDSIMSGAFVFDWRSIVKSAVVGFVAYIGKNLITGSNGRLLTNAPEVKKP